MPMTLREAAERRGTEVRQRADRPSKRRNADGGRPMARGQLSRVTFRDAEDGSGLVRFDGHASVTERAYEMWDWYGPYNEVVSASAFDETLARNGLDVPFVIGHDQIRRIARTTNGSLQLAMDDEGLAVRADLDPADHDVAYILPKLRSGLVDEMSFAFRIVRGVWSPDYTEYRIDEVDIHRGDVAIVGYGANPHTDAGVRAAAPAQDSLRARLALAIALGE
jgi:Escherichia/Staphylococcus phage prohead protease